MLLTGENDRPIYTGEFEEGGEEPALQGPAGGEDTEEVSGGGDAEPDPEDDDEGTTEGAG